MTKRITKKMVAARVLKEQRFNHEHFPASYPLPLADNMTTSDVTDAWHDLRDESGNPVKYNVHGRAIGHHRVASAADVDAVWKIVEQLESEGV